MACCLTLALLFALLRKLSPGREAGSAFAPPAYRDFGEPGDAAGPLVRARTERVPNSARVGRVALLGVCAGAVAYLVDVLLLVATGAVDANLIVRAPLVAVLVGGGIAVWRSARAAWRPADTGVAVGVAGLVFGMLGLVEMHVLSTVSFTAPSLPADLAFHGAGPLVAVWATVALQLRRAPGYAGALR